MTNNKIIILYKEVGKNPELRKVENTVEVLKSLIGGEFEEIMFEDIVIIAKKNRDNLQPNIYVTTKFLDIGSTIRGTIIIVNKENDVFTKLTKEQAVKYGMFLQRSSFNYENINVKSKYFPTSRIKKLNMLNSKNISNEEDSNIEEMLRMIVDIQRTILHFINKLV